MLGVLRLLAPALIPSWNFFDVIADSPRVEFARMASPDSVPNVRRSFRPRPDRLTLGEVAGRLLWNARWNEALFVISCAERLLEAPSPHSEGEIYRRIAADLGDEAATAGEGDWLVFRIVLLSEQGDALQRNVAFSAAPHRLADIAVA